MAVKKSRQFPGFHIYSGFKDRTITAVKEMQSSKLGI